MYQTESIVTKIADFIKTCPFLEEYSIELTAFGFEQFAEDEAIAGQGMLDAGIGDLAETVYSVTGHQESRFRRIVSFMFSEVKQPDDISTLDFRTNFVEWVDWKNKMDEVPRFSYLRKIDGGRGSFKWDNEQMWAANAQYIGRTKESVNLYNVDIHILYAIDYEPKGRCF